MKETVNNEAVSEIARLRAENRYLSEEVEQNAFTIRELSRENKKQASTIDELKEQVETLLDFVEKLRGEMKNEVGRKHITNLFFKFF